MIWAEMEKHGCGAKVRKVGGWLLLDIVQGGGEALSLSPQLLPLATEAIEGV